VTEIFVIEGQICKYEGLTTRSRDHTNFRGGNLEKGEEENSRHIVKTFSLLPYAHQKGATGKGRTTKREKAKEKKPTSSDWGRVGGVSPLKLGAVCKGWVAEKRIGVTKAPRERAIEKSADVWLRVTRYKKGRSEGNNQA